MPDLVFPIVTPVSNQYLVKCNTGNLLIDVGLSTNFSNLSKKIIKYSGISFTDISNIVITHADGDHYGCLSQIESDYPNITTCATSIEADAIRNGQSSRQLHPQGMQKLFYALVSPLIINVPAKIDREISSSDELPYLGGLKILETPGHTPGHISLWSPSSRILFCGDSIRIKGSSLSPSSGGNTWDQETANRSFKFQLDLDPEIIYAGHGIWSKNKVGH